MVRGALCELKYHWQRNADARNRDFTHEPVERRNESPCRYQLCVCDLHDKIRGYDSHVRSSSSAFPAFAIEISLPIVKMTTLWIKSDGKPRVECRSNNLRNIPVGHNEDGQEANLLTHVGLQSPKAWHWQQ